MRSAVLVTALAVEAVLLGGCSREPASGAAFFTGKTIRILVGYAPGGGYDLQARILATHLGRHVQGAPHVVVENMPGAGGLVAARYLAERAEADGLTVGLMTQIMASSANAGVGNGRPDLDFEPLASPSGLQLVCFVSRNSGRADARTWVGASAPVRLGATGPGGSSHATAKALEGALAGGVRVVSGYAGSAEIRLAAATGEVDGACLSWDSLEATGGLGSDFVVAVRATDDEIPGLDGVPDARDLATSENGRALLEAAVYRPSLLGRFYAAPRGVPAERLTQLREAMDATLRDRDFLMSAEAAQLRIAPVPVSQLREALARLPEDERIVRSLTRLLVVQ